MSSYVVFAAGTSSPDRVLGAGDCLESPQGLEKHLALDFRSSYTRDLLWEVGQVHLPL